MKFGERIVCRKSQENLKAKFQEILGRFDITFVPISAKILNLKKVFEWL